MTGHATLQRCIVGLVNLHGLLLFVVSSVLSCLLLLLLSSSVTCECAKGDYDRLISIGMRSWLFIVWLIMSLLLSDGSACS